MFKKFLSIENTYSFCNDKTYIITEKIDGSNLQLIFENGNMRTASRNQISDNFENCISILEKPEYKKVVDYFLEQSKDGEKTYNLYGEIYSNHIQKRINYGDLSIKFFAMAINGNYISFKSLESIINNQDLLVPILGFTPTLEEAFKFDVETLKSQLCEDLAEGIVIQPYQKFSEELIFKKKRETFKESSIKQKPVISQEVIDLNNIFNGYINKNRILNVLSHGYDFKEKNIENQIVLDIVADARKDFEKENQKILKTLDKKDLKTIFKFDFNKIKKEVLENAR